MQWVRREESRWVVWFYGGRGFDGEAVDEMEGLIDKIKIIFYFQNCMFGIVSRPQCYGSWCSRKKTTDGNLNFCQKNLL